MLAPSTDDDLDGLEPLAAGDDDGDGGDEPEMDTGLELDVKTEEDVSTREDKLDVSRLETASDVVEEVDSDLELAITAEVSLLLEETETSPIDEEEEDRLEEVPKVELPAFVVVVTDGEAGATVVESDPKDGLGELLGDAETIVGLEGYCGNSG